LINSIYFLDLLIKHYRLFWFNYSSE